jgi:hypothetical protein
MSRDQLNVEELLSSLTSYFVRKKDVPKKGEGFSNEYTAVVRLDDLIAALPPLRETRDSVDIEVPLCLCGHEIQDHAMNYVPGRRWDRRGACRTCGVHANGNLPCPAYFPENLATVGETREDETTNDLSRIGQPDVLPSQQHAPTDEKG